MNGEMTCLINTHRKDFILKIADCDFVAAQLPLSAVFCDDFNVSFANQTPTSLIYSWHWDFGITGILNDTSNFETPSFIYPDTGIYTVKLVVNPGDPCSDSASMQIGLYPGFFPDFVSSGICVNKPTSFYRCNYNILWSCKCMAMGFWGTHSQSMTHHDCKIPLIVIQPLE